MRKSTLSSVFLTFLFLLSTNAIAWDSSRLTFKTGATFIQPNDSSNELEGIAGSKVGAGSASTLGLIFNYQLSSTWAVEALGIIKSHHELNGKGSLSSIDEIANISVLPPTLTLQYHLPLKSQIKPYVGIGANYTRFSNLDASGELERALGGETDIDIKDSWGLAAQIGVAVPIDDQWSFNASLWYIDMDADAQLRTAGVKRDIDIKINPWVWFFGVGRSF